MVEPHQAIAIQFVVYSVICKKPWNTREFGQMSVNDAIDTVEELRNDILHSHLPAIANDQIWLGYSITDFAANNSHRYRYFGKVGRYFIGVDNKFYEDLEQDLSTDRYIDKMGLRY